VFSSKAKEKQKEAGGSVPLAKVPLLEHLALQHNTQIKAVQPHFINY
jgi:hypothetical protein